MLHFFFRNLRMTSVIPGLLLLVLPGVLGNTYHLHLQERSASRYTRYVNRPQIPDYSNHKCIRKCNAGTKPKECKYEFILEHYHTLGRACGQCPFVEADCANPHCVAADGLQRTVIVANRQVPGPTIWVCENDKVTVKVVSNINPDTTSIHWHGEHQRNGFAFMDGVPMVTQCPILPYTEFTYSFIAGTPGTHFWHSHSSSQRADGMEGSLIVVKPESEEENLSLYDVDKPDHVINIQEWMTESSDIRYVEHNHQGFLADLVEDREGREVPESMIINGKGVFKGYQNSGGQTSYTPSALFKVKKNKRYRFRLINAGVFSCPILFSIDDHMLTVIATDGVSIEPKEVDGIVVASGERFDFVLNAEANVDSYWIKVQGLKSCKSKQVKQIARLRYNGASNDDPPGPTGYNDMARSGKILNDVHKLTTGTDIPITSLKSKGNNLQISGTPDKQFFIALNTTAVGTDSPFFDPSYSPNPGVPTYDTPQLNDISIRIPPFPLLHQLADNPPGLICNEDTVTKCKENFCWCAHAIAVAIGDLVEILFVDESVGFSYHPMHMHGYNFAVVAMDTPNNGNPISAEDVKDLDKAGKIDRNFNRPVVKDTVMVPTHGYTALRIVADNPGVWLVHCHLDYHAEKGMALVLQTGDVSEFPPVPCDFPQCGSWKPT